MTTTDGSTGHGDAVLVAVAWPYASGSRHLGHLAGAYLPADIFARYHRLRGNRVLMVSGSDAHGTPITVRADEEGIAPREIVDRYHGEFLDEWKQLGMSWDLFTTTMTANHVRVAQDMFTRLRDRGYIDRRTTEQFYDPVEERFLPDRYIEGTCPHCGDAAARGDQCDACGRPLDPADLVEPRSAFSGGGLELRSTEHDFLRLSEFEEPLRQWIRSCSEWRPHVRQWSLGLIDEGLRDRPVTRDLTWGVPIPGEPPDSTKCIYVWFEAVIGYLSASIEWAETSGDPDAWRDWWSAEDARSYYFIGKDNIPFHSIIWPAMLMGYGGLNLPTSIPANHYATFAGTKASASRGAGVSVGEALDRYEPDALRYAVAALLPETADTALSIELLDTKIETELIASWGNLTHRVLAMCSQSRGAIPAAGSLEPVDVELSRRSSAALSEAGELLEAVEIRSALRRLFEAVQAVNSYLSATEPWRLLGRDDARADTVLRVALDAIATIAVGLSPYLPRSTAVLLAELGIDLDGGGDRWQAQRAQTGRELAEPRPPFAPIAPEPADACDVELPLDVVRSDLDAALAPVTDIVIEAPGLFDSPGFADVPWDELRAIAAEVDLDEVHDGYRGLRDELGIGWRKRLPAPVSLAKRFAGADGPPVRTVVDAYNRISAWTGLAFGLHDLDSIDGDDVTLHVTDADLDFDRIGGRPDTVVAGEYVYTDRSGPVCRLEVVQCARTVASPATERFLVIIQGNPAVPAVHVRRVRDWTQSMLETVARAEPVG